MTACEFVTNDSDSRSAKTAGSSAPAAATRSTSRYESNLTAVDPVTCEIKKSIHLRLSRTTPARSRPAAGSSSSRCWTARSRPIDDTTLDELWKINVGSGFSAPPMTFEVNGKQYVAIASGPSARREPSC